MPELALVAVPHLSADRVPFGQLGAAAIREIAAARMTDLLELLGWQTT
jgi:hypothetical protein